MKLQLEAKLKIQLIKDISFAIINHNHMLLKLHLKDSKCSNDNHTLSLSITPLDSNRYQIVDECIFIYNIVEENRDNNQANILYTNIYNVNSRNFSICTEITEIIVSVIETVDLPDDVYGVIGIERVDYPDIFPNDMISCHNSSNLKLLIQEVYNRIRNTKSFIQKISILFYVNYNSVEYRCISTLYFKYIHKCCIIPNSVMVIENHKDKGNKTETHNNIAVDIFDLQQVNEKYKGGMISTKISIENTTDIISNLYVKFLMASIKALSEFLDAEIELTDIFDMSTNIGVYNDTSEFFAEF